MCTEEDMNAILICISFPWLYDWSPHFKIQLSKHWKSSIFRFKIISKTFLFFVWTCGEIHFGVLPTKMKPQLSTCHTLTHSCRPIFQSVITFLCILLTASPAVAWHFPENIWVWASRHKKLHSSPRMTGGCLVLLGYSGAYIYTSPRVDIV